MSVFSASIFMGCKTDVDANPGASLELCVHRCLVESQMTSVRYNSRRGNFPPVVIHGLQGLHNGFSPLCAHFQWRGEGELGQGVGERAQRNSEEAEGRWKIRWKVSLAKLLCSGGFDKLDLHKRGS